MNRIWNFNAGPATLPLSVLEKAKNDLPNYDGTGMAVMELSHRSKQYSAIHDKAQALMAELMGLPENYKVLLLQGGASLQFAMVPMNLLGPDQSADYIITGSWSKKALKEAKNVGNVKIAATAEEGNFVHIPTQDELTLDPAAQYVHITSNNTIAGTQWQTFPETGSVPLVADMSSDILSKKFDVTPFGIIYAGAQKNLGPSGLTVVIIRDDILAKCNSKLPTMLQYPTHANAASLYNTPPTYSIYFLKLVLEWVKELGGTEAIEKRNQDKADLLYGTIDELSGFYKGASEVAARSKMNVTFRLPTEELEAQFIAEGLTAGFGGLKGHRSVGGIRVSMYNALEPEGIKALTDFMKAFASKNG